MIITLFILGASAIYILYISILFLNFLIGFNWKKKKEQNQKELGRNEMEKI